MRLHLLRGHSPSQPQPERGSPQLASPQPSPRPSHSRCCRRWAPSPASTTRPRWHRQSTAGPAASPPGLDAAGRPWISATPTSGSAREAWPSRPLQQNGLRGRQGTEDNEKQVDTLQQDKNVLCALAAPMTLHPGEPGPFIFSVLREVQVPAQQICLSSASSKHEVYLDSKKEGIPSWCQ